MNTQTFLDLRSTHNPHRWVLPVEPGLCARGGFLFGGAGLAAALVALESTCQRPVVWASAQYLSFARPPAIMDIDVSVPVTGNNVTQARASGHILDTEILTVNAALGIRPGLAQGQWAIRPEVPPPDDCEPISNDPEKPDTIHARVEQRIAKGRLGAAGSGAAGSGAAGSGAAGSGAPGDDTVSADGNSAIWCRIPQTPELSSATLAIIADWLPAGIAHALGRRAGGNSLDNTLRVFTLKPSEWILCDIRIHSIANGFAHGSMHLWAEDGTLLATASQSMILRLY